MDILERKVENQVQFWSLLGPFIILLSIAILLFKISSHWYFPLSALIGIPLCVKWKMKGMATALSFLLLLSVIAYQTLELDERYWHVGMALAMAFSFIIFTLSLEEVQGLVQKLQLESQSRLDNFLRLDEKWKGAENDWFKKQEQFTTEIGTLTQELSKVQDDKQTFYKLAQLAKDELAQVREQHDQLIQELLYKKQQIAQLYERLEETEITIQDFINSDTEKKLKVLTDRLANAEKEKEILTVQMHLQQSEWQNGQNERDRLLEEVKNLQEKEQLLSIDQQCYQQEKEEQQNAFQNLHSKYSQNETQFKQKEEYLNNSLKQLQKQLVEQEQKAEAQLIQLEENLKQECQVYQTQLQETITQLQVIEKNKTQLEQDLQEIKTQISVKQSEEAFKLKENLPNAPGNTRCIEAVYLQLKEQFQEKACILDLTRRELFEAQEKLLKYQKDYEEQFIFDQPYHEKSLQRDYVRLGRQYEKMEQHYQQEIVELSHLITHLFQQLSTIVD